MRGVLQSQVVQLLYEGTPNLNFAHVVRELSHAFTPQKGPAPGLIWDYDDTALFDIDAARVVIGYTENLPGPHLTCLTFGVGQSPISGDVVLDEVDQLALCQRITGLLNQLSPSDAQLHHTVGQLPTPDLIDRLADALFQAGRIPSIPTPDLAQPIDIALDSVETSEADPRDMDRLMRRLTSELTTRTPNLISRAIASASPKARKAARADGALKETSIGDTIGGSAADKVRRGLFWGKQKTSQSDTSAGSTPSVEDGSAAKTANRRNAAGDLNAVRAALYADDAARPDRAGKIAAQTKLVFRTIADLSHSLSSTVSDKRRRDKPTRGGGTES